MNAKRVVRLGWTLSLSLALVVAVWGVMPAQKALAAACTSTKSGNWNDGSVWSCGVVPGAGDDVTILSTHQVTLTQNEAVNNITIQSAANRLTGAFTLEVNGTLDSNTTIPNANIVSSSTTIKVVGSTNRALFGSIWGANTTGLVFEVALGSDVTGTASTDVKARSITATSGTFSVAGELRPDAGSSNSGTLTVGPGATLIVTGALKRTGAANEPFAAFTNNGIFKTSSTAGNVWPSATACSFAADSTVEYSGASQTIQTPLGSSYGNLTLSGSGTKTAPSDLPVRGNFTNNVTFDAGTGTVTFSGGSEQTIGGSSATTLNNLTINSGATVLLPTNATVNGTLTNNGTVRQTRNVNGSSDVTFVGVGGYGGVTINANNIDLGSTVVAIRGNQACNTTDTTVHRCYSITPTNATERNAAITFYFSSSELNSQTCTSLNVWRWTGSAWEQAGTTGTRQCTTEPYSVQVTGVQRFSPFVLQSNTPTAVTLSRMRATTGASALPLVATLVMAGLAAGLLRCRRPGSS